MATLLAITYSEPTQAKEAMGSVDWSDFEHLIDVKAACWINTEKGELKVHPRGHPRTARATAGGALGLLVGGLVGLPIVAAAAGVAIATRTGKQVDPDFDAFVTTIGTELSNGGSALVVLFEGRADPVRAAMDLAKYGGTVQSADLPQETLARFQNLLDQGTQKETSPPDDAAK